MRKPNFRYLVFSSLVSIALATSNGLAVSSAFAQSASAPAAETPATPLAEGIQNAVTANGNAEITAFYAKRAFAPIWLNKSGLTQKAHLTIAAFADANAHALNPDNYSPLEFIERSETSATLEDWVSLEIDLTTQFLRYATHLSSGRVQPNKVNKALNIFPRRPDTDDLLNNVASTQNYAAFLEALAPNTPQYARLKRRLSAYRDKAAQGGFTTVPEGEVLKPGMEDDRIDVLRQRLIEEDYLVAADHSSDLYDGALVDAMKEFQAYHGLEVDGVIGKDTITALNTPIENKLIQMELNMERRRWMPEDLGQSYVFVNLADQFLKVVKNEKTVHTAVVVVGKPYHATPVFSDKMTYVEVNPYWNVPYSIATKEYLPKLKSNSGALSGKGIRVFNGDREISPSQIAWSSYSRSNFPFKLRQDPGNKNALGRIKFMFPNKFNIYIHDTPSKSLFSRAQRSFSHGCIRVDDPFALGDMILGDYGYDRARLEQIRDGGQRKVIKLDTPMPVHITYLTAWMNKDGSTHFRRDLYQRDKVLLKALARAMTENL